MRSRNTDPKISSGTAIILCKSDVVVDEIVSVACLWISIVPVNSDDDNVGFSIGLNCALERLDGTSVRVLAADGALSLSSDLVLVNFDKQFILENIFREETHASHVSSEDKRCFGNSPKSKLRFFFICSQQVSADKKLTRAIVVACTLSMS